MIAAERLGKSQTMCCTKYGLTRRRNVAEVLLYYSSIINTVLQQCLIFYQGPKMSKSISILSILIVLLLIVLFVLLLIVLLLAVLLVLLL